MANYEVLPTSVFPSGTINYQFCYDNGIEISEKANTEAATSSDNYAVSVVSSVYAKVALYYQNSNFNIVVGVASSPSTSDEWRATVRAGLSWWGSSTNAYPPSHTGSYSGAYSNFNYGYGIGNATYGYGFARTSPILYVFSDLESALADMDDGIWDYAPSTFPITYRLTNATSTGPNEAAIGDTVTVPLVFPEGYGIVNPPSDAYVTCNGVLVPSMYSDGQLVFTMPDPS